ncbi:unnamed protein product [Anisakis simplex]|uniref:1-phosphatidylinositol 3-phosphate 5-kinase (inferred by orthology to a human protein) n=1 Tax=Anisakis simplex TaxID=6269 RepID=A0A0M3J7V6_ANISI|nr:unnamed protein product [Anisakis simplex]
MTMKLLCSELSPESFSEDEFIHALLYDVLDPFIHQRIAVLFGSFSAKSPNAPFFCVRPWVVQMEHYGYNDMCLGDFLKNLFYNIEFRFCFNKDYQCPSTNCDVSMLDHSRKMVYRNVCIEITTQNYIQPIDDINAISQSIAEQASQLLSWLYCPMFVHFTDLISLISNDFTELSKRIIQIDITSLNFSCKASSSIVQLNDAVVNISFAKYLDYLANGMCASCSISSFNRVRPYHVTFSPVVCTVDPLLFTRKFVDETENEIRATADSVFSKMISQLEQFKQTTDYQRYVSFYALLSSLVQQTQTDFRLFSYLIHSVVR